MPRHPRPLLERLEESSSPEPNTGCWLWTGATREGYGSMSLPGGRTSVGAHRVSWELANGTIPDGLWVLHRCDNPPCVNPEHLFLGTQLDNERDKIAKGRAATGDRNGARLHPERLPRGERHHSARLTTDAAEKIRARYAAGGVTQYQLAEEYGVTQRAIWQVLRAEAWRDPASPQAQILGAPTPCGSLNPRAKLTEQAVREMRSRHAAGESRCSLAGAYGVSTGVAQRVLSRKAWRHVE